MKDYIILKDMNSAWSELFLFDHDLTNGDIKRLTDLVNNLDTYDIESEIYNSCPYVKSIIISDNDNYHTIYI